MVYLLALISAIGIGWFVRNMMLVALMKISQQQQITRLNNIVKQKQAIPFQSFIHTFRERTAGLSKIPSFKSYLSYLETQLRRSNYSYLKSEDILGYQVLI